MCQKLNLNSNFTKSCKISSSTSVSYPIRVSILHNARQYHYKMQHSNTVRLQWNKLWADNPRKQSSWGQHGAHLGPVGPRWAPYWPHEPCYQGYFTMDLDRYPMLHRLPDIRNRCNPARLFDCTENRNLYNMKIYPILFCGMKLLIQAPASINYLSIAWKQCWCS